MAEFADAHAGVGRVPNSGFPPIALTVAAGHCGRGSPRRPPFVVIASGSPTPATSGHASPGVVPTTRELPSSLGKSGARPPVALLIFFALVQQTRVPWSSPWRAHAGQRGVARDQLRPSRTSCGFQFGRHGGPCSARATTSAAVTGAGNIYDDCTGLPDFETDPVKATHFVRQSLRTKSDGPPRRCPGLDEGREPGRLLTKRMRALVQRAGREMNPALHSVISARQNWP